MCMPNVIRICSVVLELNHVGRQTDRQACSAACAFISCIFCTEHNYKNHVLTNTEKWQKLRNFCLTSEKFVFKVRFEVLMAVGMKTLFN
jgi:hypothetical protein